MASGATSSSGGSDAADQADVGAGEVEPRHAGPALRRACRDDDEVGVGAHADVAAAGDVTAADELQAVAEVEHLSRGPRRVDVVDGDLVGDAVDHAGIGDGAADAAGSDDGDLLQPGHRPTVGEYRRRCGGRPRPRRARRLRARRHRRRGTHPPRAVGAAGAGRRPVRPAWRDAPVDRTPRPGRVPHVAVLRPLAARRRAGCRCPRADLGGRPRPLAGDVRRRSRCHPAGRQRSRVGAAFIEQGDDDGRPDQAGDERPLRRRRPRRRPAVARPDRRTTAALATCAASPARIESICGDDPVPGHESSEIAPLYTVAFASTDLWETGDEPPFTVLVDLSEVYLDIADR